MNALLICPAIRPSLGELSQSMPLVNLPALGRPLIIHWLEHLADKGTKRVVLSAADRPDQIRALVGDGRRWGLEVQVRAERTELGPEEACAKYAGASSRGFGITTGENHVADHFPDRQNLNVFAGYASWFLALQARLRQVSPSDRIGLKEIEPGIWAGLRTRVAPTCKLIAPCWLGENVTVGHQSVIGPMAVLEDGVVVGKFVGVSRSHIGPDTLIGDYVEVHDSVVLGNIVVNWKTGARTEIFDSFLISSLAADPPDRKAASLVGWMAAGTVRALTLPFAASARLRAAVLRQPVLRSRVAVCPQRLEARLLTTSASENSAPTPP